MLKKLKNQVYDFRDNIIENRCIYSEIDEKKLKRDIKEIYKNHTFKNPIIKICDNINDANILLNDLKRDGYIEKEENKNKIPDKIMHFLNSLDIKYHKNGILNLSKIMPKDSFYTVLNIVGEELDDLIYRKIWSKLYNKYDTFIYKNDNVKSKNYDFDSFYYQNPIPSPIFMFLYYKLMDKKLNKILQVYSNMYYTNGIGTYKLLDEYAIIVRMPKKIIRNHEGILHSIKEPAVQWKNNYDIYFIHGVEFDKKLWTKIVENKLTAINILKIDNIEQRYIALKMIGPEKLINQLNAKLISKTERNNELYEIKIKYDTYKILKYKCPSTDRIYVKFVPPEINSADEAQAWSFQISIEEYSIMKKET